MDRGSRYHGGHIAWRRWVPCVALPVILACAFWDTRWSRGNGGEILSSDLVATEMLMQMADAQQAGCNCGHRQSRLSADQELEGSGERDEDILILRSPWQEDRLRWRPSDYPLVDHREFRKRCV